MVSHHPRHLPIERENPMPNQKPSAHSNRTSCMDCGRKILIKRLAPTCENGNHYWCNKCWNVRIKNLPLSPDRRVLEHPHEHTTEIIGAPGCENPSMSITRLAAARPTRLVNQG